MIEKIKAEIERRWEEANAKYKETCDHTYDGMCTALDHLESFIESLEKERKDKFRQYLNATPAERRKFDLSFLGDEIKLTREELEEICELPKKDAPTIKGWVARDENGDLYAFVKKPERSLGEFELKDKTLWEDFTGNGSIRLPKEDFSDLKWEDSPIEVELLVKRV